MSVIEAKNLNVRIKKKKVLNDVNLTFEKGKIYGLLGPNGAGKTTLLKVLLGIFQPNSGSVLFQQQDLYKGSKKDLIRSIGSIIEFPGFYNNLTIKENLVLHMKYLSKDPSKEYIEKLLKTVGLQKFQNKRFSQTSLGMKQRLGIARAIAHNPELLLLDEPTNGLDPQGIKDVREMLIKEVVNTNKTVIISSHLLNEIDLMADELIFMNDGNIVFGTMNTGKQKKMYLYKVHEATNIENTLMAEFQGQVIHQTDKQLAFVSPLDRKEVKELLEYEHNIAAMSLEVFELSLEDLYLKLLSEGEEHETAHS